MEQKNIENAVNAITGCIASHLISFGKILDSQKLKLIKISIKQALSKLQKPNEKIVFSTWDLKSETNPLGKVLKNAGVSVENISPDFGIEITLNQDKSDVAVLIGSISENKIFIHEGIKIYPA